MIDMDDIQKMLVEIQTGKPPSNTTPEANRIRQQLQKECDEIKAKGGTVKIPHDIPEMSRG